MIADVIDRARQKGQAAEQVFVWLHDMPDDQRPAAVNAAALLYEQAAGALREYLVRDGRVVAS